jgi:hypothetical protein
VIQPLDELGEIPRVPRHGYQARREAIAELREEAAMAGDAGAPEQVGRVGVGEQGGQRRSEPLTSLVGHLEHADHPGESAPFVGVGIARAERADEVDQRVDAPERVGRRAERLELGWKRGVDGHGPRAQ